MSRAQRLVPRAGAVSDRVGCLEAGCDRRPRRATGSQSGGRQAGSSPDQGTGAGTASQGQGIGRNGRLACAVKKTLGGLPRRRGRMTRLEDRQILVRDIEQARADGRSAGARLCSGRHRSAHAAALAGRRWSGPRRSAAGRRPSRAVARSDRGRTMRGSSRWPTNRASPRRRRHGSSRRWPTRASTLPASSSFHRVLRAHGQMNRRGRARHRGRRAHRPRTSPPVPARSGAGT